MVDELLELDRMRADLPPVDDAAMARARATLVHTATSPTGRRRRRRSPLRIATTATAGAAAVTGFLLVSSAGDNAPAASAVTLNDDGTVTIELTDLDDMSAANQELKDAGIPAELANLQPRGSCEPGTELGDPLPRSDDLIAPTSLDLSEEVSPVVVTFRPDLIPAGTKLVVLAAVGDDGQSLWTTVEALGPEGSRSHRFAAVPAELQPGGAGTCFDIDDMRSRVAMMPPS